MGAIEIRFEVFFEDRLRRGVHKERVVQECLFRYDGIVACSCQNPKLLHLSCSHIITPSAESEVLHGPFVSEYLKKETIASPWEREAYGIAMFGPFTYNNEQVLCVPNPATKRGGPGCWPTCRIIT
jgi:hypothetical protein